MAVTNLDRTVWYFNETLTNVPLNTSWYTYTVNSRNGYPAIGECDYAMNTDGDGNLYFHSHDGGDNIKVYDSSSGWVVPSYREVTFTWPMIWPGEP